MSLNNSNGKFKRKAYAISKRNHEALDDFIQSSLDRYKFVDVPANMLEATSNYSRIIVSNKSTVPDLVIYNKLFNKSECFFQCNTDEYISYPRYKFMLKARPPVTDNKTEGSFEKEKTSDINRGDEEDDPEWMDIDVNTLGDTKVQFQSLPKKEHISDDKKVEIKLDFDLKIEKDNRAHIDNIFADGKEKENQPQSNIREILGDDEEESFEEGDIGEENKEKNVLKIDTEVSDTLNEQEEDPRIYGASEGTRYFEQEEHSIPIKNEQMGNMNPYFGYISKTPANRSSGIPLQRFQSDQILISPHSGVPNIGPNYPVNIMMNNRGRINQIPPGIGISNFALRENMLRGRFPNKGEQNFNDTGDYNKLSKTKSSEFIESPLSIVMKNLFCRKWIVKEEDNIMCECNSLELISVLDRASKDGAFERLWITDADTDIYFTPKNMFEILKENFDTMIEKVKEKQSIIRTIQQTPSFIPNSNQMIFTHPSQFMDKVNPNMNIIPQRVPQYDMPRFEYPQRDPNFNEFPGLKTNDYVQSNPEVNAFPGRINMNYKCMSSPNLDKGVNNYNPMMFASNIMPRFLNISNLPSKVNS